MLQKLGWSAILLTAFVISVLVIRWTTSPWQRSGWIKQVEQEMLRPLLSPAYLGDRQSASQLLLCYPMGLALNRAGELLISDRGRDRRGRVVWRIASDGRAYIFAGSGLRGKANEDQALKLRLDRPESMAVAPDASVLLSDGFNDVVLRIHPDGRVERFAGTGSRGFSGDGGPAVEAQLNRPAAISLDRSGNLYIADVRNHRVRRVDPSGMITTVAGTGEPGFSRDGTPAADAQLDTPWGIGLDLLDRLLIGDGANHRVRRREENGELVTLAGDGRQGYAGDGGPAIDASLNFPEALFVDPDGRLFIGDEYNHVVRVVDTTGMISTVIGVGFPAKAFIGGVAEKSPVADPESVLWTSEGLIVADGDNGRVLRIAPDGIIHLVAGRSNTEACSSRW